MQKAIIKSGLVSVIIPTYNTNELFLRQAIDSVVAQTYDNWELLIIDDSTTSPVENIVKSYTDDRIKYFRNPQNLGMANTRNRGLELAQGEFIALLDHDDIWLPEKLEIQLGLIRNNNCNMVFSPVTFFGRKCSQSPIWGILSLKDMLRWNHIVSCSCALFRTDLIPKYDLRFSPNAVPADDYAMWVNIALYGGNIACTNKPLIQYRVHENNVSCDALSCYYPYEWILKDITRKLLRTQHSWIVKINYITIILRSRAWVLRKLIQEDNAATFRKKLQMSLIAILLCPVHPQGWLLLAKLLSGTIQYVC